MTTFADLGLSPKILATLAKTTITTPTPIQVQAIPHIMAGRDLMGLAQTGTGKTAAFGLPLLHRLLDQDLQVGRDARRRDGGRWQRRHCRRGGRGAQPGGQHRGCKGGRLGGVRLERRAFVLNRSL